MPLPAKENLTMTMMDDTGQEVRVTEHHHYPLPPPAPGVYQPTFNHYGHYVLPVPGRPGTTASYTRVSTIAETLSDNYSLGQWQQRMVVKGLVEHPQVLTQAQSRMRLQGTANLTDADAGTMAQAALIAAGAVEAAEFGTAVHAWLEALDNGRVALSHIPTMYQAHARAYLDQLARHCLTPMYGGCERIVFHHQARAAGTLDRLYYLPDGSLVVGDIKTGKTLEYGYLGYAAQLALYAGATHILQEDGSQWESMPPVREDYALLIHVPGFQAEHTSVVTFDLEAGREYVTTSLAVRKLRAEAKKRVPHRSTLPVPAAEQRAWHQAKLAVQTSQTPEDVSRAWENHQRVWTNTLTQLGNRQLDLLQ